VEKVQNPSNSEHDAYFNEHLIFFICISKYRKLLNEELHDSYSSPSIITMIKLRRMRWVCHVARMGEEECIWDIGGKARRKESTKKIKTLGGWVILSRVRVTHDEVLEWRLDLLPLYHTTREYTYLTAPSLISTLYKSPEHTDWCSHSLDRKVRICKYCHLLG
jgi:hypothetical protein